LGHNCLPCNMNIVLLFPASRLLRRKIPCTGHLMTPRRLWIQTVPTQVRVVLRMQLVTMMFQNWNKIEITLEDEWCNINYRREKAKMVINLANNILPVALHATHIVWDLCAMFMWVIKARANVGLEIYGIGGHEY
jgi:hypothetical protein